MAGRSRRFSQFPKAFLLLMRMSAPIIRLLPKLFFLKPRRLRRRLLFQKGADALRRKASGHGRLKAYPRRFIIAAVKRRAPQNDRLPSPHRRGPARHPQEMPAGPISPQWQGRA